MSPLRLAALVTGLVYLTWRLLFTWQDANPVMFFLLLSAEVFGFVRLVVETSMFGPPRPANRKPAKTGAPDGDVVVVVTDEPTSEVRAAVLSARLVRGYTNLCIVDRDDRPEVAELARRLGLTRIVGGFGADLGALVDRALDGCTSRLAVLVPADVVVLPDVLEVTAGAFDDRDVAVVTCRVDEANAVHSVDYGGYGELRRRDELLRGPLDDAGALPWWPGMAVVRCTAVREIGGMSRGRDGVTLATGVRLQAAGSRIVDVPVVVARRLAPWNDDRHLHRWARDLHERLALLVDDGAPRRNEHATRLRRRVYRTADLHLGRSVQRLVLIGLLFAVMFTSSLPLVADPMVLVPLWAAWQSASWAYRRSLEAPIGFTNWMSNDLRLLVTDLRVAFRALPGRSLDLELVDPAPGGRSRKVFLVGLQVVLLLALAAFGTGLVRPTHGDFATLATLGLAGWLWVMALQARSGLRFRQRRRSFRSSGSLDVLAAEGRLAVVGVSPFGLDVVTPEPLREGRSLRLAFALPQADGTTVRFECPTAVRRVTRDGSRHGAYLRFALLTDAEVDQITEYCAVVAGLRELRDGGLPEAPAVAPIAGDVVKPRADAAPVGANPVADV
jgi:hypothetical protein